MRAVRQAEVADSRAEMLQGWGLHDERMPKIVEGSIRACGATRDSSAVRADGASACSSDDSRSCLRSLTDGMFPAPEERHIRDKDKMRLMGSAPL